MLRRHEKVLKMLFKFTKSSDQLVLTLSGDIDLEITPDVKNELSENLEDVSGLKLTDAKSIISIVLVSQFWSLPCRVVSKKT